MDEAPGLSEQYRTASPWPVFVALGIPIAEIGILFGLFPVAVGGLLLFCGSVAGMATEAGYAREPWNPLAVLAVPLVAVGLLFALTDVPVTGVSLVTRGYALLVAAGLLLLGSLVGRLYVDDSPSP